MAPDLVATTRTLLASSKTPKPEIAEGAGVSLRWLYMFANGEIPNPTLRTIQGLHSYLTSSGRNSRLNA